MFITDRTEADALLGNEKGIYSYTDLNRVESHVSDIASLFPELGFKSDIKTKTDWGLPGNYSKEEYPVQSQMDRYLNNVKKIKDALAISIQLPKSMDNLTWSGANNIEKVLQIALERIEGIKQAWKYSGELYAGEENL